MNALQGNEENLVVPVGLKAGTNGSFKMTADGINSFAPGTIMTIEDLKTGTTHNLVSNPTYLFTACSTDDPERFLLHFRGSMESTVSQDKRNSGSILVIILSTFYQDKLFEMARLSCIISPVRNFFAGILTVPDLFQSMQM